ncbi:MAG: preprotein translocase subunit SecG [Planctomycetes bacterium]|nr:preprotein translocase subunit SecG [Planctomycetota bacterium]NQU48282.1 preprotein translocase subunit SecG [Planctomycetota bacterium]
MEFFLYTLFFISALLLILIILLQEGKGGGLSDAFGGAGAATFGVRSGGISRFTFIVFGVFILSAMALHWSSPNSMDGSVMQGTPEAEQNTIGNPAEGEGLGGAPVVPSDG